MSSSNTSSLCAVLLVSGLGLVTVLTAVTGLKGADPTRPRFAPMVAAGDRGTPVSLPVLLDGRRTDATAQGRPQAVSLTEFAVPSCCAMATVEEQVEAPIHLALPVDPLLDETASPEDYRRWYEYQPTGELIRSLTRFRSLQTVLKVYREGGLDDLPLDPRARWMLSRPAAVEAEATWLSNRLTEERATPFYGPLPVRLGEDEQDYSRQLGAPDLERLALLRHELDHALKCERDRHYAAAFLGGLHTSRFVDLETG